MLINNNHDLDCNKLPLLALQQFPKTSVDTTADHLLIQAKLKMAVDNWNVLLQWNDKQLDGWQLSGRIATRAAHRTLPSQQYATLP